MSSFLDIRRDGDSGFTLVEMIVVLVLIAIASASIFPSITSMMRSSTRSAALTSASGDGRLAERLVERDLRGASAARSNGDRTDLGTSTSSVIDALNAGDRRVHDILAATPTMMQFWSEVLRTSAGPELITWQLTTAPDSACGTASRDWCIVRTMVASNGTTASEIVTRGRGVFPSGGPANPCGAGPRLFCFNTSTPRVTRWDDPGWNTEICNRDTVPTCGRANCVIQWASFSASFGTSGGGGWVSSRFQHSGFDPQVRVHSLDLITSVAVVLPSGGGFGATTERTFATTEVAIRSRQGQAYQRAIMCGGR